MSDDIGKAHLVGVGPDDSELLTVKAKRLIENSDVIFHDSLVGDVVDIHNNVADWLGGTASSTVEEKIDPRRNESVREHRRGGDSHSREGSVVDTEHSDTDYGVAPDRHAEVFDS
jgi:siroheme synthase